MADDQNKKAQARLEIQRNLNKLKAEEAAMYRRELEYLEQNNKSVEDFNRLLDSTKDAVDKVRGSLNYVYESFLDSVNELKKGNEYLNLQKSALTKLSSIARDTLEIRKGETALDSKKFKALQEEAKRRKEQIALAYRKGAIEEEVYREQIAAAEELEVAMERVLEVDKEILKNLGFLPNVVGGIDKALQKLGLPELGFQDALDKTRMMGQEADGMGGSFNAMVTFTSELGKNIMSAFTAANLLTLAAGAIVAALIKADQHTGDLAKNMGVSYKEATDFHHEMTGIANDSDYILVTTNDIINAQMKLSDAIGTSNNLSGELLNDFAGLTEQAGYTEETMLALGKIVSSTGDSLKDTTGEFLGQVELLNQQNGLSVNSKQLLSDIQNISAATVLSYGRSAEELGKAAFEAKQVGLNLKQAEQISESLLNFESSISNELEAELLTGKSLNLEKARELALSNDIAGAAKEVANQIGSAEEFTKMNRIQQEALAKSIGISRDDLAQSLMEREALARLGKQEGNIQEEYNKLKKAGLSDDQIALQLGDKKLTQQLSANSAQEKFKATSDKLMEVFTSLVSPLLPVLQVVGDIVSAFTPLFKMIGQVVKWTIDWGKYLLPIYGLYQSIKIVQGASLAVQQASLMTRIRAKGTEQAIGMEKRLQALVDKQSLAQKITYNAYLAKEYVIEKAKAGWSKLTLGYETAKNSVKKVAAALDRSALLKSIGTAAMNVISSLSKIPVIGWALGLAAAGSAIALGYKFMKGDDVVSPGYGKRTLMTPEGTISLNDKDTVIAGTDLGGGGEKINTQSSTSSINIAPLVERMMAVENVLVQILNKEGEVYIDGSKVGKTLQLASSKMG